MWTSTTHDWSERLKRNAQIRQIESNLYDYAVEGLQYRVSVKDSTVVVEGCSMEKLIGIIEKMSKLSVEMTVSARQANGVALSPLSEAILLKMESPYSEDLRRDIMHAFNEKRPSCEYDVDELMLAMNEMEEFIDTGRTNVWTLSLKCYDSTKRQYFSDEELNLVKKIALMGLTPENINGSVCIKDVPSRRIKDIKRLLCDFSRVE